MGIYLPNIEMPKEGFVEILIRDDGIVQQTGQSYRIDGMDYYAPYVGEAPGTYEAIPVPQHGDLIDRDKLREKEFIHDGDAYAVVMSRDIRNAPTIIPASKEEMK